MFFGRTILASLLLAFPTTQALATSISYDNGAPAEVNFPGTVALGPLDGGWNVLDDFAFTQNTILNEIQFSIFSQNTRTSIIAEIQIFDTLPIAGNRASYNSSRVFSREALTMNVVENGKSVRFPGSPDYTGYDVTLGGLNVLLAAGGYVLNVGVHGSSGSVVAGFSSAGGPDTPNNPGLTSFRQRFDLGQSRDLVRGGQFSFVLRGQAVNSIPVPATGALLLGGLIVIGGIAHVNRRWGKQSKAGS